MTKSTKKESEAVAEDHASKAEDLPPAGPHGKEELIDRRKTPGSGLLPEPDEAAVEGASG